MATKRTLSVVKEGATPPPKPKRQPPRTIKAAVAEDRTERDLLVAMRSKVAAEIDAGVPAHALAPLMRQLREFDKEIRALDARDDEAGEEQRSDGEASDAAFDPQAI